MDFLVDNIEIFLVLVMDLIMVCIAIYLYKIDKRTKNLEFQIGTILMMMRGINIIDNKTITPKKKRGRPRKEK